jgi:hypothetical protein
MADIFDEVGEDLRREQMKRLWQRYSAVIIGVAVLIVAGTAGWRGYETWQANRSAAAGDAFRAALATAADGNNTATADALVAFASDAPSAYATLARMRAAGERLAAGEADTALAIFEATATDRSVPEAVRDLARLRAAMIAVDRESIEAVRMRVEPLTGAQNAYRHSARELVVVAALRAQAYPEARAALSVLTADPDLPRDISERAAIMDDIIIAAIGPAPAGEGAGS